MPKNKFNLLILFIIFCNCSLATADTLMISSPNHAQDFAKCRQHFYQNTPPSLDLKGIANNELYPLCFHGFANLYAGVAKTTLFSAEHLTDKRLKLADKLERVDSFRPDSRLPSHLQIDPKYYQNQGFDKGHLAPNADMGDLASQYDSFALTNIVPQNPDHNRKIWRHIESHTRTLTHQFGESFVVTGVLFDGKQVAAMNGVFVPTHFFKAVYLPSQQAGAVYYSPNNASGDYQILSLNDFAHISGVVPFAVTNDDIAPMFALDLPSHTHAKNPAPTGLFGWIGAIIVALKMGLTT